MVAACGVFKSVGVADTIFIHYQTGGFAPPVY